MKDELSETNPMYIDEIYKKNLGEKSAWFGKKHTKETKEKISKSRVAELTIECLTNNVPSEVPGIAFLSGGQTEIEAVANLNEVNKLNNSSFIITYSYGRALQQSALKFWSKDISNIKGTQEVFNHRAKMCTLAALGKWTENLENSK